AIHQEKLIQIVPAKEKLGVIIFTHPDSPGERIRRTLDEHVAECKHALLTQNDAKESKTDINNLRLQTASAEINKVALSEIYERVINADEKITKDDLINYGLIGGIDSKNLREVLGERLRIGYANGKQLLKRLLMFNISKEHFIDEMNDISAGKRDEND